MASSMGSVMMNWTYELVKQAKRKNKKKTTINLTRSENASKEKDQRNVISCVDCETFREKIMTLEEDLEEVCIEQDEVKKKLQNANLSHAVTIERETKLRAENEKLCLEEAQLRYEIDRISKAFESQIKEKDSELHQKLENLEKLMAEKDYHWSIKTEALEQDLRNAIHYNYENINVANMSRAQLEQEIFSLQTVLDIKAKELQEIRQLNQDLNQRLEKFYWMEKELAKTRQRVEEMSLVVQNKMVAEKELMDMTEGLTNDLANARNEILTLRREIENRQYLHQNCHQISEMCKGDLNNVGSRLEDGLVNLSDLNSPISQKKNLIQHRNQHQKASFSGKCSDEPSLILDVVEKNESVAWMLMQVPDPPKLAN